MLRAFVELQSSLLDSRSVGRFSPSSSLVFPSSPPPPLLESLRTMEEAGLSTQLVPPLPSLLPPPEDGTKRADVLAIKLRLAALLPPGEGHRYWSSLVGFMQGKINREELGAQIKATLGVKGEAGKSSLAAS